MRPVRHRMGKQYVKAYFKYFPISPPEEDQDDRNALYCLSVSLQPTYLESRLIMTLVGLTWLVQAYIPATYVTAKSVWR